MVILDVEAKEQEFPYNDYTIELRFNDYYNYWFYNIISDEKSQYGVSLEVDCIANRGLLYRELPVLGIIILSKFSLYSFIFLSVKTFNGSFSSTLSVTFPFLFGFYSKYIRWNLFCPCKLLL